MKTLIIFLLGAVSALAQPFGVGLKAGVPLTDFFSTVKSQNFGFNTNTKRYILGGSAELRLPFGLGIEVDALYRHLNYAGSAGTTTETVTGNAWEFPILGKFRFPSKVVRPYVEAGFAFDTLTGLKQSVFTATGISSAPSTTKTGKGFVMGAGIEIKALIIHISPEIRYTHWGAARFVDPLSLVNGTQNQAEFLLGISF